VILLGNGQDVLVELLQVNVVDGAALHNGGPGVAAGSVGGAAGARRRNVIGPGGGNGRSHGRCAPCRRCAQTLRAMPRTVSLRAWSIAPSFSRTSRMMSIICCIRSLACCTPCSCTLAWASYSARL